MPLLLRKLTNMIYEIEGSAKVGKLKGLHDVMFFDDVPPIDLLLKLGEILTLERGHASKATAASSDIVEIILPPACEKVSPPPSCLPELFGMRRERLPREIELI
jgi:hypothetical protein